jgi:sarcosine oxidase delta subunit
MDERDFFEERTEQKVHTMVCPHCNQPNEYELNWLVRRKRAQIPRGADEMDRARFAKAQSYMVRRDDMLGCKNIRCRKRFEITGLQSVADLQAVPTGSAEDRAARIRAAFGRKTAG